VIFFFFFPSVLALLVPAVNFARCGLFPVLLVFSMEFLFFVPLN